MDRNEGMTENGKMHYRSYYNPSHHDNQYHPNDPNDHDDHDYRQTRAHQLARAFASACAHNSTTIDARIEDGEDYLDIVPTHAPPDTWDRGDMTEQECHLFNVSKAGTSLPMVYVKGVVCMNICRHVLIPIENAVIAFRRPFCVVTISSSQNIAMVSLLPMEARRHTIVTVFVNDDPMDDQCYVVRENDWGGVEYVHESDLSNNAWDEYESSKGFDLSEYTDVEALAVELWDELMTMEYRERTVNSFDILISKMLACPATVTMLRSMIAV